MRKIFASLAFGAVSLFLLLGSSCSVAYDLSADQCRSNGDCVALFGQGHTCDLGICTCKTASCLSVGGSSGKDGGGSSGDAGESSGDAGMSGKGGIGGTGGAPVVAECKSHKECFTLYPDDSDENPRACVDGTCVPLMTPDCPAVLPLSDNGKWNLLRSTDAIILGAYAPINGTTIDTIGSNYDLAVTELSDTTRGVFAGSPNRRQVVVVLCNDIYSTQDQLLVPSKHLMEELKVPGVVSALFLQDQAYVWENVARDNGVFMMMPFQSDQELIDTPDDGLMWHMLSGANQLSVSYQPLLDMIEKHLVTRGALGASEDLKIVHVKAKDQAFLQDTASYLDENLQFNGQSISDNLAASLYTPIQITSAISEPTDPQTGAIDGILTAAPHVVIGTTAGEMLKFIIPGVEKAWVARNPGKPRPFYLLGTGAYLDPAMAPMIDMDKAFQDPLYQRILGVNWPAAVNPSVYEAYQERWVAVHSKPQGGYENFYDAMYYLLYGVAAARAPLTGKQIATNLLRVIGSGPKIPQVEVGPGDDMVTAVLDLKDTSARIELIGAMGPPNWDAAGGRNDPASVWCVNPVGAYQADQLRYDPSSSLLLPSDPANTDSDIGCFTFPAK
jgi:hypothetical protein